MKKHAHILFGVLIILMSFQLPVFSQKVRRIDSIVVALKDLEPGIKRIDLLNAASALVMNYNPDSALIFSNEARDLSLKYGHKVGLGLAYSTAGDAYQKKGDHSSSAANHFKSLSILEEMLRANKNDNVTLGRIAAEMNGLGIAYENMNNQDEALKWYLKGLEIDIKLGDKMGMAGRYNNLGAIHMNKGEFKKGKEYFLKSLKINEEIKNDSWKAINLGNLGNVAEIEGNYEEAIKYNEAGLEINRKENNMAMVAIWLGNIGSCYDKLKNYKKAEEYYIESEKISAEIGDMIGVELENKALYKLYKRSGQFKKALEFYEKSARAKDTIFNAEKYEQMTRSEVSHEFEIKRAEQKVEQDKKDELAVIEKRKRNSVLLFVIAGLVIVFISAVFIWRSLRIVRRQKILIEKKNRETELQKHLIQEQHKDILDSIYYARRIQRSLLPTEKYIERQLNSLKFKVQS